MGKSSPAGTTTVNNQSAPSALEAPFLVGDNISPNGMPAQGGLWKQAAAISATPLQFPNFQTYASPTSAQNQAIQSQINLGQNDPVTQAAMGGIQPYLNGSMLSGGNPYLGGAFNAAAQTALPATQSGFAANGRFGSGAMANAQANALTNLAGNMAYQNYSDQSTNQLKAMLEAPGVSSAAFNDIGNVAAAGAQQQAFNQLPITQAVNQFQFNQDAPFLQASRMQSLLGNPITSSTSTSPYFTNPVGSAIGTASGALGLYNAFNQAGGTNGVSSLYQNLFGSSVGSTAAANGAFDSFNPVGAAESFGGY